MNEFDVNLDVVFKIIEIVSFIGAGIIFLIRSGRASLRMESAIMVLKEALQSQADELSELKTDFKKITQAMTQLALQDLRLNHINERVTLLDNRYEELRHGEGFVYPLWTKPKEP
jgi:single-stranded DNA-specific DHH superfamily exonuclease